MAAKVFTADVKSPSTFSTQKRWSDGRTVDAATATLLKAVTVGESVADVLDILSSAVGTGDRVTANSIGQATSVKH